METLLEISDQRRLPVHLMPVPIALFRADPSVNTSYRSPRGKVFCSLDSFFFLKNVDWNRWDPVGFGKRFDFFLALL